jgi:hypothetical protein
LGCDPKRKWPAKKAERQVTRKVQKYKRDKEPQGQQKPRDSQVFAPVFLVPCSELHRHLLLVEKPNYQLSLLNGFTPYMGCADLKRL